MRCRSRLPATLVLALGLILSTTPVFARQTPPESVKPASGGKVLTLADYGGWKRINATGLSPDGHWASYAYRPNEGDDTLFFKALDGASVRVIPNGASPTFSNDSRWAAFLVSPPEKEQEKLRKAKQPITRTLHVMELASGTESEVPDVASFHFSEDAHWLAARRNKADRNAKFEGADLILRDLQTGTTENIGNVGEYAFSGDGRLLAYTVDAADRIGNGVYLLVLGAGRLKPLDTGAADYRQLAWSEKGSSLAVLRGLKPEKEKQRVNSLLTFTGLDGSHPVTTIYDPTGDSDFPTGMVVSDLGALHWSKDGARVFLGIKEQEPEPPRTDSARANVDVWHWNDEEVQSVQMVRANAARRFTYAAVFNVAARKFLRLADEDMRTVTPAEAGHWAVGRLDKPYRHEIAWGGSRADYYRIDLNTGERTLMVQGLRRAMGTSPDGRWFLYFQDSTLWVRNLDSNQARNLSALAGKSFVDATDDHPYELPSYGLGGWTRDGKALIANERYDLWLLPLSGGKALNLTAGLGDAQRIRFRVAPLDRETRFRPGRGPAAARTVDTSQPIVLSAYGDTTKKSGYYRVQVGRPPQPLLYVDKMIGPLAKADSTDRVLFTEQTFREFPDYWVSDLSLRNPRRVTDANPQLADYAWGRRVLIDYTDARGNQLQATLTLPANYQPGQRYPMLVYFYETMSERHHQFSMPVYDDRPHMSTYASNGYLVLMPDVVYEIGRPGSSAVDDVTSAVKKAIELGYADPAHIGLQGHSWGGYQSSYILTQTDIFAAVVTGAPPTDLVSFYDELYKSTGTVQQGITEVGQVRMGAGVTPWSARKLYESQSPVHQAENITTPFLILQGTADGAVDWDQGLEFYNAARRLGKKVIFLSYPDEGHHLAKKENQKDFQVRMKQFFDHYLKGAPAPAWMTDGVPFLKKGESSPTRGG